MPRSTSRPALAFAAIALAFATVASLQSQLVPVITIVGDDLGVDTTATTWALTIWLITAAVATPLLGRVGDLIGRKQVFIWAIAAVGVGSIVGAVAPNLGVLLVARVLQGIGGAVFPLGFGLARDAFPAAKVPARIGALSAMMAVASGLGTVISGPLAELVSWRGLFALPLVLSVAALGFGLVALPDTERQRGPRPSIAAAALLSAWLVALLLPLSMGAQWGWGSPAVIGLFVAAALLIAAWIAVELKATSPLVDMRLMRMPVVWSTNLTALLTGAGMFGVWTFMPRLVETPTDTGYGLGGSVTTAGLVMLPMLVTMAVVGLVMGPLSRLASFKTLLISGATLSGLGILSMALWHHSPVELAIGAGIMGIGTGLTTSSTPNLIVASVAGHQVGIATGMNANVRTIGGAVGTTLFSAVIGGSAVAGVPTEGGYVTAFAIGGILGLLAALAPLAVRTPRPVASATEPTPIADSPVADVPDLAASR